MPTLDVNDVAVEADMICVRVLIFSAWASLHRTLVSTRRPST
jgi:hypothetical protein